MEIHEYTMRVRNLYLLNVRLSIALNDPFNIAMRQFNKIAQFLNDCKLFLKEHHN